MHDSLARFAWGVYRERRHPMLGLGQGVSFHSDVVSLYAQDFYCLSALGLASTGRSSLESMVAEHLQSMIASGDYGRCDWCGFARCGRCGECHNPDCEVYYELDCEEDDEDEDDVWGQMIAVTSGVSVGDDEHDRELEVAA